MASKFSGKGKRVSAFAKAAAKSEPKQNDGDLFDVGKYRVRFVDCSEGENGALCVKLAGDKKVGERIQWFSTVGKSIHVSAPRIKSLCMAIVGISDAEEYSEFDPHGEFINAIVPFDTDAAAAYLVEAGKAKNAKAALALIAETEFQIKVSKGGERDDGDFFRNATFSVLSEADDSEGDEDDDDDSDDSDDESSESERKPSKKAKPAKASKRCPVEDEDSDEEEDSDAEDSEDDSDDEEPESEPVRKPAKKAKHK